MNLIEPFQRRFGGTGNIVVLCLILIICLRFSGAEWKDRPLDIRLLYALYLLLGVCGVGLAFAAFRVLMMKLSSSVYKPPNWMAESIAAGLKVGLMAGALVLLIVGLMLVDNFLGPLQGTVDAFFEWLAGKLS